VFPPTKQRCCLGTVSRRWPPNSLHASVLYSEYNKRFWLIFVVLNQRPHETHFRAMQVKHRAYRRQIRGFKSPLKNQQKCHMTSIKFRTRNYENQTNCFIAHCHITPTRTNELSRSILKYPTSVDDISGGEPSICVRFDWTGT